MDLPGLREIQLWGEPAQVEGAFDDIQQLAAQCRFRDCTHNAEPGCAVQNAGLDAERLANFRKMQKELGYVERKPDPRVARDERQRKTTEKSARSHPKRGGK
jgi:ribosome biogenesis GTPase